jgi:hypothetical protein
MPAFKDQAELRHYLGMLYDEAKCDARIAPKIRDAGMIVRFRYDAPQDVVTMNVTAPPTQPGAYFDVLWGEDTGLKPTVEMSMKADIAHAFWHGRVNLMQALTRRQIIAKGPIPKILKLLPAVEPMYEMYPRLLHAAGRDDLVLT